MPPIVHLIRHAEGWHNVIQTEENYNKYQDPVLTPFGESQARSLRSSFTHKPDLIVISPMTRTIQTALLGVVSPDIPTILHADMQETDFYLCNKGSDVSILRKEFAHTSLDFSVVPDGWNSQDGRYASSPEALAKRALDARHWLRARPEKRIVVVTHAGFLQWLLQEPLYFENAVERTFVFADGDDEEARLTRVFDARREEEGMDAISPGSEMEGIRVAS